MRYIPKGPEPDIVRDFKAIQQSAGLPATYENFHDKRELNDILRAEQHNICCYCQRRIDHYQGNKDTGAHNEHLSPQCEDPGDGSVDLDNNNIFACCIVSKGLKKKSQHCGESKGNDLIVGSIKNPECQRLFKYNLIGEILPNGPYDGWDGYLSNYAQLPRGQQLIIDEIKILNLNCNSLVDERKKVIETIVCWAAVTPKENVISWLKTQVSLSEFPIFYSCIKYILENIFAIKDDHLE